MVKFEALMIVGMFGLYFLLFYNAWWMQQVANVLWKDHEYCPRCGKRLR